jgi:hypothetical protein
MSRTGYAGVIVADGLLAPAASSASSGFSDSVGRVTQIQPPLIAAGSPVRTAAVASLADAVN